MICIEIAPVSALSHEGDCHLAALALLSQLWQRLWPGEEMPAVLREERGKPRFSGDELYFSLSHDGDAVACALTDEGEVGLDLVALDRPLPRAEGVAERYFTASERRGLRSPDSPEYRRQVLRLWGRKEAAVKLSGLGLSALADTDTVGMSFYERVCMIEGRDYYAAATVESKG